MEKALAVAEKTIAELKTAIAEGLKTMTSLTKECDEYRSIRGQLDMGKLQSENTALRKQNGFFKSIIEQHGLGIYSAEEENSGRSGMPVKNGAGFA